MLLIDVPILLKMLADSLAQPDHGLNVWFADSHAGPRHWALTFDRLPL